VSALTEIDERIGDYLSERFGDAATVEKVGTQTLIVLANGPNSKESKTICKFGQVMEDIKGKGTWFQQRDSAKELAYEIGLRDLNIPVSVRSNQTIERIKRPTKASPMERFTGDIEAYRRISDIRQMEENCWTVIENALNHRHPTGYAKRIKREENQHSLYNWMPKEARQKKLWEFDSNIWSKVNRRLDNRIIRFDIIYHLPETEENFATHLFAEIKPYSSLANKLLTDREQQLNCYHAWLLMTGAGNLTPLAVVEPGVFSWRESDMYYQLSRDMKREIIPMTVTTPEYLADDLNSRANKSYNIIEYGAKRDIPQRVIDAHEEEYNHLQQFISRVA
jgi:hypothetical protein